MIESSTFASCLPPDCNINDYTLPRLWMDLRLIFEESFQSDGLNLHLYSNFKFSKGISKEMQDLNDFFFFLSVVRDTNSQSIVKLIDGLVSNCRL